jgi:hypothetical protein
VSPGQGDQIGRIFAYWAVFLLWAAFENYKIRANYWAYFIHGTSGVLILTENGLGDILGDKFHKPIWSPWPRGTFLPNYSFHLTHVKVHLNQGDQIWQIFALWAVLYFGHFLRN